MFLKNKKINKINYLGIIFLFFVLFPTITFSINEKINYQAKIADSSGTSVSDGDYNLQFRICSDSTCTAPNVLWTETHSGANKIAIKDGLFSILLGSITGFGDLDFSQTLYLGVNVGGTSDTPSWDGEMTPRKEIGSVNSSFVTKKIKGDVSGNEILANSTDTVLNIKQEGTGNILVIEDEDSDTTPFLIDANGNVNTGANLLLGNPGDFNQIDFLTGAASSRVLGVLGTNHSRFRITSGNADTFDSSLGASIDLHGNTATSNTGLLDLIGGSAASADNPAIRFFTNLDAVTQITAATILGNGNLGIGTTTPEKRLTILDASAEQLRLSFDADSFSEFLVGALGNLEIKTEGGRISGLNENLLVCEGGACPTSLTDNISSSRGSIISENSIYSDGGLLLGQINSSDFSNTTVCQESLAGMMRKNSTSDIIERCNGNDWVSLESGEENFGLLYFSFSGEDYIRVKSYNFSHSGNITSATASSITDSSVTFATDNSLQGKEVLIYDGTAAGSRGTIASNTATSVTISGNFTSTPDNTSRYVIANRNEFIEYRVVDSQDVVDKITNSKRVKTFSYDGQANPTGVTITYP